MCQYTHFIGIDVSKDTLDFASCTNNAWTNWKLTNKQAAIEKYFKKKAYAKSTAFVLEATGVYHLALAYHLYELGYTVLVANPKQSSHFAKFHNMRQRNDQIDARLLAKLGKVHTENLKVFAPKAEALVKAKHRCKERSHYVRRVVALKTNCMP